MKTLRSISLLLCFVLLMAGKSVTPNYGVGDTVTDFKLKNVNGKMVSLSDYKNSKGVIVIFDCNTCPVSKAYNTRIKELHAKYAKQGFPVVAINSNSPDVSPGDSFDEMVKYSKKHEYTHDYLFDETQEIAKAFGATNTPHVFVLKNENNSFKVAYIGAIDDNTRDASSVTKKYAEDAINALLGNKPVPTSKTKAIGCTIKWKNA